MTERRTVVIVLTMVLATIVGAGLIWRGLDRGDDEAGLGPGGTAWLAGASDARRTLVVGDSVTFLSREEIAEVLGPDHALDVRGLSGYKTDELLPVLRDGIDDHDPDVAVVFTGHNDVLHDHDAEPALTQMADLLQDEVRCVVWVELPVKGLWPPDLAASVNQRIAQLAEDRDAIHLETTWRDAVDDSPGVAPSMELVQTDQVHPNEAGQRRLAEAIGAAVRSSCG